MGQHLHRHHPTSHSLIPDHPAQKPIAGNDSGHAGPASRLTTPIANPTRQETPPNPTKINKPADPPIQATAHAVARGATLRRHLVNVPARIARPQGQHTMHLPAHWPQLTTGRHCGQHLHRHHPASHSLIPDHPAQKPIAGNDSGHAGPASRLTTPIANPTRQETPPNPTRSA